jgi:hypothetical protein
MGGLRERQKVQCPECAGDVPVLREFCPHCGAPTDPGLRARQRDPRGDRSGEELRGNRKKVLIGGAAIVLALAVMGKISMPGPNIHIDTDHDDRKGPVVIQAQQLFDAYREDEDAADKRFDDREMVVSGEFLRIVPDGYGSLDLRLKTSDPDRPVGVDVAGIAIDDAKKLRPGQKVTVSCQGMGGSDETLWVRECAIQSAADASAVPAPPKPPAPPAPPATGDESGG